MEPRVKMAPGARAAPRRVRAVRRRGLLCNAQIWQFQCLLRPQVGRASGEALA